MHYEVIEVDWSNFYVKWLFLQVLSQIVHVGNSSL